MKVAAHDNTTTITPGFEELYIGLRGREQRLYSDEEVANLPKVSKLHPHREEWEIRKASCQQLVRYLAAKKRPLKILEVGCGNGWLSHQLAKVSSSNVLGLDINKHELRQAERVFGHLANIDFVAGELSSLSAHDKKFDILVFAASAQYFQSLAATIRTALNLLSADGEVHIIDTHFYKRDGLEGARHRSRRYFESNGFEEMQSFYFHHSVEELHDLGAVFMKPSSAWERWLSKKHPFPWICIRK